MIRSFTVKLAQTLALLMSLCCIPAPHLAAATLTDESISVDGHQRRFLVHDFSGATRAPLVIVLHGGGGNGQNAAEQTGFDTVAEREKLIAVYPYGSSRFDNFLLTWNAGHCCSYAMEQNVDDIHFIELLIDDLIARHNVDPARVYVTGLSNGGMLTHRIGFELSDKVAAVAPVIASVFGDEPVRDIPVPALIINGADDQIVRVNGGELGGIAGQLGGAEGPTLPVAAQGEYWADVNGCGGSISTTTTTYQKFVHACANGKAVERYLVTGNGHAWPGGTAPRADADQPVKTFDANEVIWDFFKRFTRSPVPESLLKPYYFDGNLSLPLVSATLTRYRAHLQLTRTVPALEFDVIRAETVPVLSTALPILPTFVGGVLQIPEVHVGAQSYTATFSTIGLSPLRFRLDSLTALP